MDVEDIQNSPSLLAVLTPRDRSYLVALDCMNRQGYGSPGVVGCSGEKYPWNFSSESLCGERTGGGEG